MKKIISIVLIVGLLTFFSMGNIFAADNDSHAITITVSEIAELALEDNSPTVTLAAGLGAGLPGDTVQGDTDSSMRLFYTTLVGVGTKKITAELGQNISGFTGLDLTLTATPAGTGTGTEGLSAGAVNLDASFGAAVDIITAIGTCATGRLGSNGAQLLYTLVIDPATVVQNTATTTVTLTLLDT